MKISFPEQINSSLPRVLFFASLLTFFVAATHNLTGSFSFRSLDEYYKFQVALKFMRIFLGQDECVNLSSLPADARAPFLMYLEYVGWPHLYIAVGLMSVLGKVLGYFFVFRFSMVLCAVLALSSMWVVLKRWLGEWPAALTVFFVGCNVSYIQAIRHAFFCEVTFQVFGLWLGTALCVVGQRRKNNLLLYSGFFVFGLTLWAKIMFVAYLAAAPAAFLALGREKRDFIRALFPERRNVLFACAAFISGAAPFVWFNVRHGFPTLRLFLSRIFQFHEIHENWDNSAVHANLLRRIKDFYMYLSGNVLFEDLNDSFVTVYIILFLCAFVWGCAVLFGRRGDGRLKLRLRVLFVFYAVVFCLTCFVPNRHRVFQILIMVPFSGILCSLFLVNVGRVRGLLLVPVLVCGLWFNEQLGHSYSFSRDYIRNGRFYGLLKGEPDYLASWLDSKKIRRALCSDPLGHILNIVRPDMALSDLSYLNMTPALIAREMRLFISEVPGLQSYMLIYGDEGAAAYTKIKDSALRYRIKIGIVDSRVLRNDPAYTFLLCRISLLDEQDANGFVMNGADE